MKAKNASLVRGIRMSKEELQAAEWLAKATKRSLNNAVNWAVGEKAEELGYKPKSNNR